ncbi:hypothetical protein BU17DRAFT_89607 [Hysterangium stoloniferum]|nr:hypothetical protein BU17DRAFT_89607 [Hysterangium stoloniferum]
MVHSLTLLVLAGAAFSAPLLPALPLGGLSSPAPVPRDVVDIVAPLKAVVDTVANPVTYVEVDGIVKAANVAIKDSTVGSNIGNHNDIKVARQHIEQRDVVDIEGTLYAVVKLLANLCAKAGVDVQALLANVKVYNSSILSNILNGNDVNIARGLVNVEALIAAAIKALVLALVKLGVPVEACLANINISYSDILSGILQYNDVSVLSRRSAVDIFAIAYAVVQALVQACVDAQVDIKAVIANLDIQYSTILTHILNGNKVDILRRTLPDVATVVLDLIAYVTILIQAAAKANVNVVAALLNIGIDCSSILSNIGNGNDISVLSRDLVNALVPVKTVVLALIQACLGVDADVAASILNVVIQHSSIGSDILNYNVVHVL